MARKRKADAAVPAAFDGFHDVAPLHLGQRSAVYSGVETASNRPVALRHLRLDELSPARQAAFWATANRLGAVTAHPNAATVLRTDALADGSVLQVTELCPRSLAEALVNAEPLAPEMALTIGVKVAGAIETAHRYGVLHLDLCPAHVRFTVFGEPAVADFGLADLAPLGRVREEPSGIAALHAAPELLESGAEPTPAADIYALASLVYELLNGKPPFGAQPGEGSAIAVLKAMRDPVPPFSTAGLPVALFNLLAAAMAKRPEDRPAGAAQLGERFREIQSAKGWPTTELVVLGGTGAAPWEVTASGAGRPADSALAGGLAPAPAAGTFADQQARALAPPPAAGTWLDLTADAPTAGPADEPQHPLVAAREAGLTLRPMRRSDLFNAETMKNNAVVPLPDAAAPTTIITAGPPPPAPPPSPPPPAEPPSADASPAGAAPTPAAQPPSPPAPPPPPVPEGSGLTAF